MSSLPSTSQKIVSLADTRYARYRKLQIYLAKSRRELAVFSYGLEGAKIDMLLPTTTVDRRRRLQKYVAAWTKKVSLLERRCQQLLAGMDVLQKAGALI